MKTIDPALPVARLVAAHPELVKILSDLGFREITRPVMLATVGKFMTLKQGASLRGLDYEAVLARLRAEGFTIQEERP